MKSALFTRVRYLLVCHRRLSKLHVTSSMPTAEVDIKLGEVNRAINALAKRSQLFWKLTGFLLVCLIGLANYAVGYEVGFSLFYLIPISLVTWFTSQIFGIIISILSAAAWLAAGVGAGQNY